MNEFFVNVTIVVGTISSLLGIFASIITLYQFFPGIGKSFKRIHISDSFLNYLNNIKSTKFILVIFLIIISSISLFTSISFYQYQKQISRSYIQIELMKNKIEEYQIRYSKDMYRLVDSLTTDSPK